MEDLIVVGIDIGTTKVCTLVGREESPGKIRILGSGVERSAGMKKGVVIDLGSAVQAVLRSIDKAERTSGMEIASALVSLAGADVTSVNSRGVVGVIGKVIDDNDVARAIDAARAVAIPHNQEIIHVIQRGFNVDGQDGIRIPMGMHGYRLEIETHIITASETSVENIRQCVAAADVEVSQFVLNPLASGEVVLNETERQMGAVVVDIGAGTTDMAIYIDGDVWHTAVLGVGGNLITSDIAHGLRLPMAQAEQIKLEFGRATSVKGEPGQSFNIRPFGEQQAVQIRQQDLIHIINARVEEIFSLVVQEIKRSGYDGLLPAGIVLTGGTSNLAGITDVASSILGVPARIGKPENLLGKKERLESPEFSTSVGLLHWAQLMNEFTPQGVERPIQKQQGGDTTWDKVKDFVWRLFP